MAKAIKKDDLFESLVENALDFLKHAIDEFEAAPKYSIIHFYAAVELFLKARLLAEHWTLVVSKDADHDKFVAGDFISVTFVEACSRLSKIVKSGIDDSARIKFDSIRKHRNKMVHFFHESKDSSKKLTEEIAIEQLGAWYELQQLLTVSWAQYFEAWEKDFSDIERRLKRQREYLAAKFEALKPQLEKLKEQNVDIETCASCHFDAAQIIPDVGELSEAICLVCGHKKRRLNFACPECEAESWMEDGGEFTCPNCKHKLDEEALVDAIDENIVTQDNYFENELPANCGECEGYHTVVLYKDKYLCVRCLDVSDQLENCGWCSEANTGNMENSSWSGCTVCDGRAGDLGDD